ncbi:helix-turn-helix domain-containing protein [Streptomyces sp. C10]|uniref:helix-turn-helix domain-containing protein n=1 Tax=Streptomyces sp. C10 TaxID=531941 RepID=UPI00397FAF44
MREAGTLKQALTWGNAHSLECCPGTAGRRGEQGGTETEGFAGLLRLLKERSGRSYGVLARQVHMSVSTLHRYCHGDAVPKDFAPVDRLARRCGAAADELVELHRRWILADEARRRSRSAPAATTSSTVVAARAPAAGAAGAPAAVPGPSAPRAASAPPETFLATAPTSPGPLVGRDTEVERTAELLRMPAGDPVLIVTGDPGAGKTALLDVALHTARAAGMRVLFRWRPAAFGGFLGACHCVELPFVFDRTELPGLRGPRALLGDGDLPPDLASRMHRAWISFAATGDPGWQPYRTEDRAEERAEDRAEDRAVRTIDARWTMSQVRGGSNGA